MNCQCRWFFSLRFSLRRSLVSFAVVTFREHVYMIVRFFFESTALSMAKSPMCELARARVYGDERFLYESQLACSTWCSRVSVSIEFEMMRFRFEKALKFYIEPERVRSINLMLFIWMYCTKLFFCRLPTPPSLPPQIARKSPVDIPFVDFYQYRAYIPFFWFDTISAVAAEPTEGRRGAGKSKTLNCKSGRFSLSFNLKNRTDSIPPPRAHLIHAHIRRTLEPLRSQSESSRGYTVRWKMLQRPFLLSFRSSIILFFFQNEKTENWTESVCSNNTLFIFQQTLN